MMRLAVNGVEDATRRKIADRLRGAVLSVDEADCDAAVFLGPVPADRVERLLAADKPVLLAGETPPAEALDRLAATGRLAIVNPDRSLPSRRLIRQQLDAGKLGEVGLVRLHRWEPAAAKGGLLRDLDLVLYFVGKLPERAYAVEAGPFVQVHLGFPGGGMALLDHFTALPPGDGYASLSVIGSTGAAYADDHHNSQLLYQGGPARAVRTGEGNRYLVGLLEEFAAALRTGRDLSASVADWRRLLSVSDAVSKSLASRQAVALEAP
jgi:predicted dehydrogenase